MNIFMKTCELITSFQKFVNTILLSSQCYKKSKINPNFPENLPPVAPTLIVLQKYKDFHRISEHNTFFILPLDLIICTHQF